MIYRATLLSINGAPVSAYINLNAFGEAMDKCHHGIVSRTPIDLSVKINLPMASAPTGEHDAMPMRREPNGGYNTSPMKTDVVDYGESLTKLDIAMSHLREAVPNGQTLRTRYAMQQLLISSMDLFHFLHNRNVV